MPKAVTPKPNKNDNERNKGGKTEPSRAASSAPKEKAPPVSEKERPKDKRAVRSTNSTMNAATGFGRETLAELKRVTWPSRQDTINLSVVVILISAAIGSMLGIVDVLLVQLLKLITGAK